MRLIVALKSLVFAVVNPARLHEAQAASATAVFAVAVLLLTTAETGLAYLHAADPKLETESVRISLPMQPPGQEKESVALSNEKRQFTAIMGGALLKTFLSLIMLSALALGVARFLTDKQYSVSIAIICVSAATGIDLVRFLVETPLHITLHTVRFGLHLGVFVDPSQNPLLFSWLQRLDVFGLWYYVALSIGITTSEGLHRRFGIVVGVILFGIVQIVFAGLTLIAWLMSGSM
ncbi:MAG: hypothetical protein HYX66_10095 [Ignavibacteria bacterium]|nr:hypothetical protein [Ignavibacteria bacterium]